MLLNVRYLIKLKGKKVLNNLFCRVISFWEGLGKFIVLLIGLEGKCFLLGFKMVLEIICIYVFCIYLYIVCIEEYLLNVIVCIFLFILIVNFFFNNKLCCKFMCL